MYSKSVLIAAAAFLGLIGLALTFAPAEILALAHIAVSDAPQTVLFGQFAGALCLGSAMANWMCRDNSVGGIYGRPLSVGNLVQFTVAALALDKAVVAGRHEASVLGLAGACSVLAVLFAMLVFGAPGVRSSS